MSGYSIVCMSMNSRLLVLSLNYSSVIGSNVIDGSGLNIDVSIVSRLWLMCVDIVSDVSVNVSSMFSV